MSFYNEAWDRPYLTPSIAKVLIGTCPLKARHACPYYNPQRDNQSDAMMRGTIIDRAVFGEGLPDNVQVVDVEEWRSKADKQLKADLEAQGITPIKRKDYDDWMAGVEALREAIRRTDDPIAAEALSDGVIKERIQWGADPYCSTEPDIWLPQRNTVLDIKSTGIVPTADAWQRHVAREDMDLQVGATMEAAGATRFGWLVVEDKAPYASVVHWASPMMINYAQGRWARAKSLWQHCVTTDHWPSYVGGEIDPMDYKMRGEEDRAASVRSAINPNAYMAG